MKISAVILLLFVLVSCSSTSAPKMTIEQKKAELYYNQGTEYLVKKNYTKALDNLLKAYGFNSNDEKILNNLAMAYYFKGKPNMAKDYFEKVLDLNPKNSDARNNLASILYHFKKFNEAQKHYNAVLEDLVYDKQYRTHYNLGLVYLKQGRRNQAISSIKKATELKTDYCAANHKLGMLYKETYHYTEAYKWFKKGMMGTCVNEPETQYQAALTLIELKKFDKAEETLRTINERFASTRYSTLATLKLREVHRNIQVGKSDRDSLKEKYFGKRKGNPKKEDSTFNSPSF